MNFPNSPRRHVFLLQKKKKRITAKILIFTRQSRPLYMIKQHHELNATGSVSLSIQKLKVNTMLGQIFFFLVLWKAYPIFQNPNKNKTAFTQFYFYSPLPPTTVWIQEFNLRNNSQTDLIWYKIQFKCVKSGLCG